MNGEPVNDPDDASADCGRAEPLTVSALLESMPDGYGTKEREAMLAELQARLREGDG